MKNYLKRFRVLFIILACMLAVYGVLFFVKGNSKSYTRTNTSCKTEERVFDYGELLTDEEEESLRQLITKREQQIGCDIVLVTLNEPVGNDMYALMNYADDFYDDYQFGFDAPWGDGVLLVDNWYSYGDYNGDTWMSTSGRVEDRYSSAMINDVLEDVFAVVNDNPYQAYTRYVNDIYEDMSVGKFGRYMLTGVTIFVIAAIVTGFYLMINLAATKTKKTTTAQTYVVKGASNLREQKDTFVTKHVTTRRIESSSSGGHSGGGGHHTSSGGHSHGGGGGHH